MKKLISRNKKHISTLLLCSVLCISFVPAQSSSPDTIYVGIGQITSFGIATGVYHKSATAHKFTVANTTCDCWTREDITSSLPANYPNDTLSLGNIDGQWYLFKSSSCPDNPTDVAFVAIGNTGTCNPTDHKDIYEPKMNLVVPAYLFPLTSGYNASFWNSLNAAADQLGERLIVIITPPRPSNAGDISAYTTAINNLRTRGARVIGYVEMDYGNFTDNELISDRDGLFSDFSNNFDGVFYDEAHLEDNASSFAVLSNDPNFTYKNPTIFNPGVPVTSDGTAFNGHQGWIVQSESDVSIFDDERRGHITNPYKINNEWKKRSVVMIHNLNASNWENYYDLLRDYGYHNFYLTDDILVLDDDGNEIASPYDVLPAYFDQLVNKFASQSEN